MNKTEAAAQSLRRRSSQIDIQAYPHYFDDKNSKLFNDDFLRKFSVVFAGVDAFQARYDISFRRSSLNIPMFTGGITHTIASWSVIIPKYTMKYLNKKSQTDSITKNLACTLKWFPRNQEHCVHWAAIHLNKLFSTKVKDFQSVVQYSTNFFLMFFLIEFKLYHTSIQLDQNQTEFHFGQEKQFLIRFSLTAKIYFILNASHQ
jgi:molybdopterin/thiamine biosynthesis adenylyltransferase